MTVLFDCICRGQMKKIPKATSLARLPLFTQSWLNPKELVWVLIKCFKIYQSRQGCIHFAPPCTKPHLVYSKYTKYIKCYLFVGEEIDQWPGCIVYLLYAKPMTACIEYLLRAKLMHFLHSVSFHSSNQIISIQGTSQSWMNGEGWSL